MPKQKKKTSHFFLRIQALTDRWTTDNSGLEKLRCLSAGGAKKKVNNIRF